MGGGATAPKGFGRGDGLRGEGEALGTDWGEALSAEGLDGDGDGDDGAGRGTGD